MTLSSKPLVGISACLLGEPVRYDGGHKRDACILETLSDHFQWLSVCPEAAAGLGVPRPPVQLMIEAGGLRALGVRDRSLDVTQPLESFSSSWLRQWHGIAGFILKSRSPSCGLRDTPWFDMLGREQDRGPGIFARALISAWPDLPVEDETGLQDPQRREDFVAAVTRYAARSGLNSG